MSRKQPISVVQGGYSDMRLWPCYIVISGLMLYLMPQIGMFWSTLIVFLPFFLGAKWIADRQPQERYDIDAWNKAIDIAISKNLPIPKLENYKVIVYKKPRIQPDKEAKRKIAGSLAVTTKG
jgi:hypothetical protein